VIRWLSQFVIDPFRHQPIQLLTKAVVLRRIKMMTVSLFKQQPA